MLHPLNDTQKEWYFYQHFKGSKIRSKESEFHTWLSVFNHISPFFFPSFMMDPKKQDQNTTTFFFFFFRVKIWSHDNVDLKKAPWECSFDTAPHPSSLFQRQLVGYGCPQWVSPFLLTRNRKISQTTLEQPYHPSEDGIFDGLSFPRSWGSNRLRCVGKNSLPRPFT
jgi:hypothetical protein